MLAYLTLTFFHLLLIFTLVSKVNPYSGNCSKSSVDVISSHMAGSQVGLSFIFKPTLADLPFHAPLCEQLIYFAPLICMVSDEVTCSLNNVQCWMCQAVTITSKVYVANTMLLFYCIDSLHFIEADTPYQLLKQVCGLLHNPTVHGWTGHLAQCGLSAYAGLVD